MAKGVMKGINGKRWRWTLRIRPQLLIRHFFVNIMGLEREQVSADATLIGSDDSSSPFGAEVADIMPIHMEDAFELIPTEPSITNITVVIAKDVGPETYLVVGGMPEYGDENAVPLAVDEGACVEIFLGEMESDGGEKFWEIEDSLHRTQIRIRKHCCKWEWSYVRRWR